MAACFYLKLACLPIHRFYTYQISWKCWLALTTLTKPYSHFYLLENISSMCVYTYMYIVAFNATLIMINVIIYLLCSSISFFMDFLWEISHLKVWNKFLNFVKTIRMLFLRLKEIQIFYHYFSKKFDVSNRRLRYLGKLFSFITFIWRPILNTDIEIKIINLVDVILNT